MSNRVNAAGESDRAATPETRTGAETIEAYEDSGNVVFYDAENPIAWIESDSAVALEDAT